MEPITFEAIAPYVQWMLEPFWPFVAIMAGIFIAGFGWGAMRAALSRFGG